VRDWLKELPAANRKTVQFAWPLGMPLVRHLEGDIWEVRIRLDNTIARVLFTLEGSTMVLLHGFIKNSKPPRSPT
jgi:phage-related protein